MLEFEEALSEILAAVPAPTTESVSLCDASGRVLMEHLRSPIDLPIFANSAMDGYVVRSADVASAKPASPVCLRLAGKVAPGEAFTGELTAGTCIRIFTGSPLPLGADAVVMQEDARKDSDLPATVKILAAVGPGEYVRSRGEDMKCEATLAAGGDVLTAGRIGLLAAVGLTSVRVGCLPVVGLLATGSELTEPGQPLAPGCIYESNRSTLAVLLKCAGAVPKTFPLVPDTLAGTGSALANAFHQCDAVVTSGGVSVGEVDFLKRAFTQIGGELDFWKVAIKPGRPLAFGRLGPKLLFGLPGNPVSAFVTFLLLVRPALRRWQGATDVSLPTCHGVLVEPLANHGERRHFMRVRIDSTGKIQSAGTQASHMLSSLAAANGLVDVPAHTTLASGSPVTALRWDY